MISFGTGFLSTAVSAADFQNLGFDEADTTATGVYLVEGRPVGHSFTSLLLPGWTLNQGTDSLDLISLNEVHPSIDAVLGDATLFDAAQGKFALKLSRPLLTSPLWDLEQTATIPAGVQYLAYRSEGIELRVEVSRQLFYPINGKSTNGLPGYSATPMTLLYDISDVAGQEVTLAFIGPFPPPPPVPAAGVVSYIDNIRFVSPPPTVHVAKLGTNLVISWPNSVSGYVLQERELLNPQATWSKSATAPVATPTDQTVTLEVTPNPKVFRLGLE